MDNESTTNETVYGALTLNILQDYGLLAFNAINALRKAHQWLLRNYRPFNVSGEKSWVGKELFRPDRIDRVFELSVMLTLALEEDSL